MYNNNGRMLLVRNEVRVMGDGYKSGRVVGRGLLKRSTETRYLTRTGFCPYWVKYPVEVDLHGNYLLLSMS